MVTIREFELRAAALLATGRLQGSLHVSVGQEAVAAGICSILNLDDLMTTTHRGHGHCIAKGAHLGRMMAELMGKAAGYCKGRSGSMHIAAAECGILGANAIMAAGIPMALGAAYALAANRQRRVVVAFFGDGAVAEGAFHESMNMAS